MITDIQTAQRNSQTYAALAATAFRHAAAYIGRMRRILVVTVGAILVREQHQFGQLQLLRNVPARLVQAPSDQLGGASVHIVLELATRQSRERLDVDRPGDLMWINRDYCVFCCAPHIL